MIFALCACVCACVLCAFVRVRVLSNPTANPLGPLSIHHCLGLSGVEAVAMATRAAEPRFFPRLAHLPLSFGQSFKLVRSSMRGKCVIPEQELKLKNHTLVSPARKSSANGLPTANALDVKKLREQEAAQHGSVIIVPAPEMRGGYSSR